MAHNQTIRIRPAVLQNDLNTLAAIAGIETYNPSNTDCKVENLQTAATSMTAAEDEEIRSQGIAMEKRDDAASKEWEFHNLILAAKAQVIAQYGDDSSEVQKLGLKKKSEYRAPARRQKPTPPQN
jgi:hypothetical protein